MKLLSLSFALAFVWIPQAPSSPPEELADALECRIVREEEAPWGVRLQVEVRNKSPEALEPLSFRVTQKPKKRLAQALESDVDRVKLPFAGRSGRSVPAKGKQRYWVQAPLSAGDGRFDVRVTRVDPAENDEAPEPELEIGRITNSDVKSPTGQTVSLATVKLKNPAPRDVDVVFLATFEQPRNGEALLGVRIRASSEREWIIGELPAKLAFSEEPGFAPTRVSKLELVDWSWVDEPDRDAAAKLFRSAYDSWVRWPTPRPRLSGRFEEHDWDDERDVRVAGTFRVDVEGRVTFEIDPSRTTGSPTNPEQLVRKSFDDLFVDVLRPTSEEVLEGSRMRLVAADAFEVDGPGWWNGVAGGWSGRRTGADGEYLPNFTVRDGRIALSGNRSSFDGYTWDSIEIGGGWALAERRNKADQWVDTYEHQQIGERVVPVLYRHRFGFVDRGSRTFRELRLSDLRIE